MEKWTNSLVIAQDKMELISDKTMVLKELGFVKQIFEKNSALQKCSKQSVVDALTNKCTLEFSYMGLIKMLKDNGSINHIEAHLVYVDEEFDYTNETISHKKKFAMSEQEHNSRGIVGAYSVATLPTNDKVYCFMPIWELNKVKDFSKGGSIWKNWRDEMYKKSVIKRHFKTLLGASEYAKEQALASIINIEQENHPIKNHRETLLDDNLLNDFENVK
jgi:recombinational DNA repair protein RecT